MTDTASWTIDPGMIDIEGDMTLLLAERRGKQLEGWKVEFAKDATDELRAAMQATRDRLSSLRRRDYEPSLAIAPDEYLAVPDQLVAVAAPPLTTRPRQVRIPADPGDGTAPVAPTVETDPQVRHLLRNAAGLDPLPAQELPEHPFLFYAVVVGSDPAARAAFVRKHNPAVNLRTGIPLFSYGDRLTRVDRPLFKLDDHFDLVVTTEGILVLNQTVFDALFRDAKTLVDRYPVWAGTFHTLKIGDDQVQILVDRCQRDSRLATRLRQIFESGHLATGKVKAEQVLAEADRLGLGRERFLTSGKLDFGCAEVSMLLKLLNEDLFIGGLSKVPYEAGSKSRASST